MQDSPAREAPRDRSSSRGRGSRWPAVDALPVCHHRAPTPPSQFVAGLLLDPRRRTTSLAGKIVLSSSWACWRSARLPPRPAATILVGGYGGCGIKGGAQRPPTGLVHDGVASGRAGPARNESQAPAATTSSRCRAPPTRAGRSMNPPSPRATSRFSPRSRSPPCRNSGNTWRWFLFGRARCSGAQPPVTRRDSRTGVNGCEHLPCLDKLGVTGSSPSTAHQKAPHRGFLL